MKTNPTISALAAAAALLSLTLAAGPARAASPCDALFATLRNAPPPPLPFELATRYDLRESHLETWLGSTSPVTPASFVALVTPECQAETRRGAAPEAAAAARAWTQRGEPGWVDRGRIILCAMQDPAALAELPAWMADDDHAEARAVCVSELATWPGAEAVRARVLSNGLRRHRGSWPDNWEVDPAIVAAANVLGSPALREQLVPLLETARTRRASGHDRLREALCTEDDTESEERTRVCRTPAETERDWGKERRRSDMTVAKIGVVVCYAGIVATTYLDRDKEDARKAATVGGVIGGATVGSVLGGVVGYATQDTVTAGAATLAGLIAGGVLGGVAAHALAASPGARTPVTAVGFAPIPLLVLTL